MKIAITGAAGRIGQCLTRGLIDEHELTLLYRSREVPPEFRERCRCVKADLSNEEEVRGLFEGQDAIIHLAAVMSSAGWDEVLPANIVATYNVFEEARRAGVGRIVYASSNHVQNGEAMEGVDRLSLSDFYIHHRGLQRISDKPAPDSFYGVAKVFAENLGWYYWRVHGIRFVALRIGVFSAPDDTARFVGTDMEHYARALFLSPRDCVQAFSRALVVEAEHLVAYAISDNDHRIYDMKETTEKLGYHPQDNSADYF